MWKKVQKYALFFAEIKSLISRTQKIKLVSILPCLFYHWNNKIFRNIHQWNKWRGINLNIFKKIMKNEPLLTESGQFKYQMTSNLFMFWYDASAKIWRCFHGIMVALLLPLFIAKSFLRKNRLFFFLLLFSFV